MTTDLILAGFAMLEGAGIRKPVAWTVPEGADGAKGEAAGAALLGAAELWAVVLEDVSDDAYKAAILARIRAAEPFWPTVGQILALVPARRLALVDDTVGAWADVERWLQGPGRSAEYTTGGYVYPEPTDGDLDVDNNKRDDRLRLALANVGGNRAYKRTTVAEQVWFRKRWEEAYREVTERARVVSEGAAVLRLEDRRKGAAKCIGGE